MLERTLTQTVWWFLGHWVTIAAIGVVLGGGVITASALAARSAPAIPGSTTGTLPGGAMPTGVADGSAAVEITLTCATGAALTLTAIGVGDLELTVDGPSRTHAAGAGAVTASLAGPAGRYSARFTATGRIDRVTWTSTAGMCSG